MTNNIPSAPSVLASQTGVNLPAIADEEALRADFYDFLGNVLATPPDEERLAAMRALLGGEGAIGDAIHALNRIAADFDPARASREFHDLFIGLGRGELLPYASYYMTGFLNEKPLARLRADLARLQVQRAPGNFDPEDGIATLMSIMGGLIRGRFGAPASLQEQRTFFGAHVAPWAEHFFADLEGAKGAVLYAPIGAMGRALIRIEKEAFRLGVQEKPGWRT